MHFFPDTFVGYPGSVHDTRVLKNSPVYTHAPTSRIFSSRRRRIQASNIPYVFWHHLKNVWGMPLRDVLMPMLPKPGVYLREYLGWRQGGIVSSSKHLKLTHILSLTSSHAVQYCVIYSLRLMTWKILDLRQQKMMWNHSLKGPGDLLWETHSLARLLHAG